MGSPISKIKQKAARMGSSVKTDKMEKMVNPEITGATLEIFI
jgi:hypothetical protein